MKKFNSILLLLVLSLLSSNCNKDDDIVLPVPSGNAFIFDLATKDVSGISGRVMFVENTDTSITIISNISGTPEGGEHPAHIHFNTASEGGGIALSLGSIDGDSGKSEITISALDDGTPITYAEFLNFDGYINVHLSASELGTIVAQGDIGQNVLTGTKKSFDLGAPSGFVGLISGRVTFSERVNGEALAEIMLMGTPAGGEHPAHIHANTAAEGGGILFSFNPVDGDTGLSVTNVAAFDNGSVLTYSEIEGLDGYVNVHVSASELGTIVAQGDIGQNELTGESKVYTLAEKDAPTISGSVTFSERVNGTALAVLEIQNTPEEGIHPAHLHDNNIATGGGIAFTFNAVDGNTGFSYTQVETLDNSTAISYDDILTYNGYINVHLSASQLGTIVAHGNIGSNE